jgi:hypothetical protein
MRAVFAPVLPGLRLVGREKARTSRGRITGLAEERGVGPGEGGEDHITIGEKKRWAKFP